MNSCFVCHKLWVAGRRNAGTCFLGPVHKKCFFNHGYCGCAQCGEVFPSLYQCCMHKRFSYCPTPEERLHRQHDELQRRLKLLESINSMEARKRDVLRLMYETERVPQVQQEPEVVPSPPRQEEASPEEISFPVFDSQV